jgi:hypothetical protein
MLPVAVGLSDRQLPLLLQKFPQSVGESDGGILLRRMRDSVFCRLKQAEAFGLEQRRRCFRFANLPSGEAGHHWPHLGIVEPFNFPELLGYFRFRQIQKTFLPLRAADRCGYAVADRSRPITERHERSRLGNARHLIF